MEEDYTIYAHGRIILTVPPLPCYVCERLTDQAEIETEGAGYLLHPRCWEHGYTDNCGKQAELDSIVRFIIGFFGEGSAQVLEPCALATVPGYQYPESPGAWGSKQTYEIMHMEDRAWTCRYYPDDEETHARLLWVVFSFDTLKFCIYPLDQPTHNETQQ